MPFLQQIRSEVREDNQTAAGRKTHSRFAGVMTFLIICIVAVFGGFSWSIALY